MKNHFFSLFFILNLFCINAQNVTLFDTTTPIHSYLTYKMVVKSIGEPDSTVKSTWTGKKTPYIKSYYNNLGLEIKYHNYKHKSKFKTQFIKEIYISKHSSLNINNLPIIGLIEFKLINTFGNKKQQAFEGENPFYTYTYLQKKVHFDVNFYFDSKGEVEEIYITF